MSSADPAEAFKDIDVAILVGAFPRKEGMERKDLLKINAKIFETQGKALDTYAKKTVKVRAIVCILRQCIIPTVNRMVSMIMSLYHTGACCW